ncbi:MAG: hypothetical protein KAH84_07400 [Thiomargarita sp.]|nr:hypothetical protein [Thiomargarita sp.]
MQDFIVIDTEGTDELTEIAIVDHQGQVIYEAFVKEDFENQIIKPKIKTLKEIIQDFIEIAQSKLVVCHYAEHDIQVLKNSFQEAEIAWISLEFDCTFEKSKQLFPAVKSYSLAYLSQHLKLKVDNKFFNEDSAHRAKYDASFTYQLYRQILLQQQKLLTKQSNPFGISRVDTPFQDHIDLPTIFQTEFEIMKSILLEIKQDNNHQSRGVVVIGEAGSGKTHLMMRLAKEVLGHHRLLFIRQPNHPKAVLYHIYSRILESFVEIIPDSNYSQLEYLLAQSLSKITIDFFTKKERLTKNQEQILNVLSENPLNIYSVLGREHSQKKQKNWEWIEKSTLEWWSSTYGFGGKAIAIIKGLIKFCYYTDLNKRELVRKWLSGQPLDANDLEKIQLDDWQEEINQEDFALEAIGVFSKLSIVDEPLIIIFDQLEGLKYHEQLLINFGEAVKEIFTYAPNCLIIINLFPDRWLHFKRFFDNSIVDRISQHEVFLNKPSNQQLKQILVSKAQSCNLEIEHFFTLDELDIILGQTSIRSMLNWASHYYKYKIDNIPLPQNIQTFEERTTKTIKNLQKDIAWLKQIVNQFNPNIAEQHNHYELADAKAENSSEKVDDDKNQVENYLTQQRCELENLYDKKTIISDYDDVGKIITIAEAFKTVKPIEIDYLKLGKKKIPEHILFKTRRYSVVIGFLHASSSTFTARIKNFNQLVIRNKDIYFELFRDQRENEITGKIGKEEIEKLNNASNGKFYIMNKEDRLNLELIYKFIVDVQNKDLEVNLSKALILLEKSMGDYWLIASLI